MRRFRWRTIVHGWAWWLLLCGAMAYVFTRAPIEQEMREVQKIFYFHVGIAWTTFLAFAVTAVGSGLYLWRGDERAERVAAASGEVGWVFATLILLTGSIWAKSAWNTWWNWEPRLTSMLVLWILYAGYLMFRASVRGERRRRLAAVYGIVAFLMVPVVYWSIQWWGSLLHPPTTTVRELDSRMYAGMYLSALTMVLLFAFLVARRTELRWAEETVEHLRQQIWDQPSQEMREEI